MKENEIDEIYVQTVLRLYTQFMGQIERRSRIDIRTGLLEFLQCEYKNGRITQDTLFKAQEDLAWLIIDDEGGLKIFDIKQKSNLEVKQVGENTENVKNNTIVNGNNEEKAEGKRGGKIDTEYIEKILRQRHESSDNQYARTPNYRNTKRRNFRIFTLNATAPSKKLGDNSKGGLKTEFAHSLYEEPKHSNEGDER